uniref:Uncharacterized protein n=1 Tax=Arundo donax TaxID=35708 RepID=A0A0A9DT43_ARUDO
MFPCFSPWMYYQLKFHCSQVRYLLSGSVWHCGGFSKVLFLFLFLGRVVSWKHLFRICNSKIHTRNGKYSSNLTPKHSVA